MFACSQQPSAGSSTGHHADMHVMHAWHGHGMAEIAAMTLSSKPEMYHAHVSTSTVPWTHMQATAQSWSGLKPHWSGG
jgi:hydroxymethylpyrimidine/phosphomethylpyrimidine kinase